MNRFEELLTAKGADLIKIADGYGIAISANKERTQLKEAKNKVAVKIYEHEQMLEKAAKAAEKAARAAQESAKAKKTAMTSEEKKAARAARYEAKKAKRAEIMKDRCAKTETFEYNGKVQTLTEWSKELGILRKTLYRRIYYYGWTVEKAFAKEVEA